LEFEAFQGRDIGQNNKGAEHLALLPVKDRAARTDYAAMIAQGQDQLTVFLAIARAQGFAQNLAQGFRQPVERMVYDLAWIQAGDLSGFVVKDRYAFVRAGRDHAGG
jgi:hypothetical protein